MEAYIQSELNHEIRFVGKRPCFQRPEFGFIVSLEFLINRGFYNGKKEHKR